MTAETNCIAGWYGKIPATGDFISRRLPNDFIETWDKWLQHAIIASRTQLEERWLDCYLNGPIWHFILMPGVSGHKIWTGVLMPSVDNVGRYFPLTFALPLKPSTESMLAAISAQSWHMDIETLALSTLNIHVSPEDIEQGLNNLVFPSQRVNLEPTHTSKLASWWQLESGSALNLQQSVSLPDKETLEEQMHHTAAELLYASGTGKSIWWRITPAANTAQTNCYIGLPPENSFSELLAV